MAIVQLDFDIRFEMKRCFTRMGWVHRPMVPIRLSHDGEWFDTEALIDTAADYCTFDKQFADRLRIPRKRLEPGTIQLAVGQAPCDFHLIDVGFAGRRFSCQAAFIDNPDWTAVVGRHPIFSELKVAFRQSVGEFYISSSP